MREDAPTEINASKKRLEKFEIFEKINSFENWKRKLKVLSFSYKEEGSSFNYCEI